MPPTVTKKDPLVGKQVRSKASGLIGRVIERVDHEPQYLIEWTNHDNTTAQVHIEKSDVEAI